MTKTYAESKIEMEKTNIISDPNDVLGLQYTKYKSSLYSESLSKPSSYFKLKQELEDKLKENLVSNIYKVVYELLRYGVISGDHVCGFLDDARNNPRIPGVPSSKVNELSLSITATMNDFIDSVINLLMPPSFLQLAENKLTIKSEASVL